MSGSALEDRLFDITLDDCVIPFAIEALDIRGRLVRMGPLVSTIVTRHDFPAAIARMTGEAIALAVLLGSSLKTDGRFILQTQSDGPVSLLVVDFMLPDRIRACARFDANAVGALGPNATSGELLGSGHLAMTVDQGKIGDRYQGIVALDADGLQVAAHNYFIQSEQIPTRLRLAGAELVGTETDVSVWRAGGMLIQHFPKSSQPVRDLHPGDMPEGHEVAEHDDHDHWVEAVSLVDTLEDHELTDPGITAGTILHRLFNEHDTGVFDPQPLVEECRCSADAVTSMLASFPEEDRGDINDEGLIEVKCEFCSTTYALDPDDVAAVAAAGGQTG